MRVAVFSLFLSSQVLANGAISTVSGGGGAVFTGGTLTSPLLLDGSNTLCSQALALAWANDTDTGFQRAAANTVSICLGGAEGLRLALGAWTFPVDTDITLTGGVNGASFDGTTFSVDATNNRIGIGTAAPTVALDVVGAIVATTNITAAKRISTSQTATCAAGVVTVTPTTDLVLLDSAGAACVATISESGAVLGDTVRIIVTVSPGAGIVTFPDVANVFDGPTLCTNTGVPLNGSLTMTYTDEANDLWVANACVVN